MYETDEPYHVVLVTGVLGASPIMRTLGAYRLATELRRSGFRVKVLDFFGQLDNGKALIEQALNIYVSEHTLWLGFSSTFQVAFDQTSYYPRLWLHECVKGLKTKLLQLKVVLGGSNAYVSPVPLVDIYLEGYADATVVDLTLSLSGQSSRWTAEPDRQSKAQRAKYDMTASSFDFVLKGDTGYTESDNIQHGEPLPLEIGRGCIFKCKFCSYPLNGKKANSYIKDSGLLKDELVRNYERHGTLDYTIVDDTFNDSTEKLEQIHSIISGLQFKPRFSGYCRADLMSAHPEQTQLLREIGFQSVFFGVESLNLKSAASIGKGSNRERLIDYIQRLRSDWPELLIGAGFIVGLPHETEETFRSWSSFLVDKDSPFHSISLNPLYLSKDSDKTWRSELEIDAGRYGYVLSPALPKQPSGWINTISRMTFAKARSLVAETLALRSENHPELTRVFDVPVQRSLGLDQHTLLTEDARSSVFEPSKQKLKQRLDSYVANTLKG